MEDHINELFRISKEIDIKDFIHEIQQIDYQLKSSQKFLFKEIQRLKQDLDKHYTKFNYANELRTIDQITLKTFQTKFQNLKQVLSDIKQREVNTWNLVQSLRVNISRLWHIFESANGNRITDEIIYEDFEKFLNDSEKEKQENLVNLILLEKEHGDLLIKMKEIQINLEDFRTKILQITQNINQIKFQIKNQQIINDHIHEQTLNKFNEIILNTKNLQLLLIEYKSLQNEIYDLIKLIFNIQTQIEIYHKSILIYQTKLEKYKQDLILIIINRSNYEQQILNLKKILQQQNKNLEHFKKQQIKILKNRQQFHQHIHNLENNQTKILNHQQKLLDIIKEKIQNNNLLKKEILYSNKTIQNLNYSYQKLINNQNKQQNRSNNLHKTIDRNERQLKIIKVEINRLTEQINQENSLLNSKENQIEFHTKDLQNLENYLSITHEELNNQRNKVRENQFNIKLFTQNMHKLKADEKPIIKEISHNQKQIIQNHIIHNQLELNIKQNEGKMNHYKTIIAKLIFDFKENERILKEENFLLKQLNEKKEKSKENIQKLNKNLKYTENNYQNLIEIFHFTNNENKQLKQQYADLTFVIQLLGQRQTILNNQLQPLYNKLKSLTTQYHDKVQIVEQSKTDLDILRKYHLHLQSYNHQLHQSLSFTSQKQYEYLHSQSLSYQYSNIQNHLQLKLKINSNHIHYWHTCKINSPDKFNNISKLFLIKKKLIKKSNEFLYLKKIFYEKNTLYRYLNQIYIKRQKLINKMNTYDILKDQLIKQKILKNELLVNKDDERIK